MAIVHVSIQAKGGVGKTLVAFLLTQYLRDHRSCKVHCLDMDQVSASLSLFRDLQVIQINMADLKAFFRSIQSEESHVVIDAGVSEFLPFCSQLQEVFLPVLAEAGHTLILHTVVVGGQSALSTLNGVRSLITNFPMLPIIAWLNPFFGPVALQGGTGGTFADSKVYQENVDSFRAVVGIPDGGMGFSDMKKMLELHMTFREAKASDQFEMMPKNRLAKFQKDIIGALDSAQLCEAG